MKKIVWMACGALLLSGCAQQTFFVHEGNPGQPTREVSHDFVLAGLARVRWLMLLWPVMVTRKSGAAGNATEPAGYLDDRLDVGNIYPEDGSGLLQSVIFVLTL